MILSPASPLLIPVIHLPPLPGTPYWRPHDWQEECDRVIADVSLAAELGFDGVLLQSADRVYPTSDTAEPGRVAGLTVVAARARAAVPNEFSLGVQLLRNGVSASLAVARMVGGNFVRAGAVVGASLTTHGWVAPDTERMFATRVALDASSIKLLADIKSTHFQWPMGEMPIESLAKKAALVGADGVVIDYEDPGQRQKALRLLSDAVPDLPIVIGGHVNTENIGSTKSASAIFVRGCLVAPDGNFDRERAKRLLAAASA